jgi:predicted nucleotidyltransferase
VREYARLLAERVAARLGEIEGVAAVALGGSWAREAAHPDSDVDLGIYYHPDRPPSVEALRHLARELDDRHPANAVTDLGEWGPWINGGAWLQIEGRHVDWLYRDLDLVGRTIDECRAGRPSCSYQPGHPHGFHNHIDMGEVHYCRPLVDPRGVLTALKSRTAGYPPPLKRALIDKYLWEADFALSTCAKSAARGDVFYVAGCLFRSVACLVQVLFALNERYFVNEKGSVNAVDSFAVHPTDFGAVVSDILAHPSLDAAQLRTSAGRLEELVRAVRALCPAER